MFQRDICPRTLTARRIVFKVKTAIRNTIYDMKLTGWSVPVSPAAAESNRKIENTIVITFDKYIVIFRYKTECIIYKKGTENYQHEIIPNRPN